MNGPSGKPYCSKKCTSSADCSLGTSCVQTSIATLKVCGDPRYKGGLTPNPGGGGSLNPPKSPDGGPPALSPGTKDTTKPSVSITVPHNNSTFLGTYLTVSATITDASGIKHATVRINGAPRGTLSLPMAGPYFFVVRLSRGTSTVEVEALDKAGNLGVDSVSVKAPNAPVSLNVSNKNTSKGTSKTASKKKGYGKDCMGWKDCHSGLCAHDATLQRSYCTKACNPAGLTCPGGSSCQGSLGGSRICAPDAMGQPAGASMSGQVVGAGCSMGSPDAPTPPPPFFALLALVGLLVMGRRN